MNSCTNQSPQNMLHSAPSNPQLPALCLLALLLAAWPPGLGWLEWMKNIRAAWHSPRLWLQTGGAAGSNAILLMVHVASISPPCRPGVQCLKHGAPANNRGRPSTHSPTLNSFPRIGGLDRAVDMSRVLRDKQHMKPTQLYLPRLLSAIVTSS